jgi:hypothetical protein
LGPRGWTVELLSEQFIDQEVKTLLEKQHEYCSTANQQSDHPQTIDLDMEGITCKTEAIEHLSDLLDQAGC